MIQAFELEFLLLMPELLWAGGALPTELTAGTADAQIEVYP